MTIVIHNRKQLQPHCETKDMKQHSTLPNPSWSIVKFTLYDGAKNCHSIHFCSSLAPLQREQVSKAKQKRIFIL